MCIERQAPYSKYVPFHSLMHKVEGNPIKILSGSFTEYIKLILTLPGRAEGSGRRGEFATPVTMIYYKKRLCKTMRYWQMAETEFQILEENIETYLYDFTMNIAFFH